MKYLVDANVLSEVTKPNPSKIVVQWLRDNEQNIVLDPIVLGEVRYGILLLPAGARRRKLEDWFARGIKEIHCLPWDASTGLRWGGLLAQLRKKGKSMPVKDSMIAATALHYSLTVVTHNTADFVSAGIKVVNPFF